VVVVVGAVVAVVVVVSPGAVVAVVVVDVVVVVSQVCGLYASPAQLFWAEARGAKARRSRAQAAIIMPIVELRRCAVMQTVPSGPAGGR
jgi:hypothetical protein